MQRALYHHHNFPEGIWGARGGHGGSFLRSCSLSLSGAAHELKKLKKLKANF